LLKRPINTPLAKLKKGILMRRHISLISLISFVSLTISINLIAVLATPAVAAPKKITSAQTIQLRAGPMVGATAMRQAKIWIQATGEGSAAIEYWAIDKPKNIVRTKPQMLSDETDHIAHFTLGLLEPGVTYGYRVLINSREQKVPQTLAFKTQPLWQWRGDPPAWKLAFGSCVFSNEEKYDRPGRPYGGPPEAKKIFETMAKQQPDLTLWGGDYLYFREADEDSELGLRYRWRYDRGTPEQQVLLRTGSHISIWDDHEYGPNDSNSSYRFKGEALTLFKRYWANASYGLPETPGIFGVHRFNDAEIFMLDNRYYRDSDELQSDDKSKLGEKQLRWLKNALLSSVSPIKIIAAGSQITNEVNRWESWTRFPKERADLLKFLSDHKINGVLFLTGDRHFTELLKNDRAGTYPLYELTCSPLLSGVPSNLDAERANKQVVEGTFVAQRNFCTVEFSGTRAERKITMRSFSTTGEKLWERDILLSALQTPK
jgi:alkaline phosphatase D